LEQCYPSSAKAEAGCNWEYSMEFYSKEPFGELSCGIEIVDRI
jgi:hypothetical protein